MQPIKVTTSLSGKQTLAINRFLSKHPSNTVFQSPLYHHFYLGLHHFKPIYFLLCDEKGNVLGVLLAVIIHEGNGLVSLISARCVVYGGPIIKQDNPDYLDALLKSLNKVARNKCLFTQFRNFRIWSDEAIAVFEQNGFKFRDRLNILLNTTEKNQLLKNMSASRRRQIRKALASGAQIREASSLSEVRTFYLILKDLYRFKVRKPLPKWEFFEAFFNQLIPESGILLLVWHQQQIIGGILAPITPKTCISELYIVGLDNQFPVQHPSVLATWAAMDYAIAHQIPIFDFMGLGKPDVPYGVRDFKVRFGGTVVNLGRFGKRNFKFLYTFAELGYNILRKFNKV